MASKEKINGTPTTWRKNRAMNAFGALLAAGPMAAAPAHAQTASSTPEVIHLDTLGEHPFAQSMSEALDDAHLERVFTTSVQEGQLVAADHDAFIAAGRAQRASIGDVRLIQPHTQFPWMTDRLDPATGVGSSVVEWDGQIPFRARTFSVTRANGTVAWFGVVEATMNGRPCYNFFPVAAPAPEVVQRVEAPCPEHMRINVDGLPDNARVTQVLGVDTAGANRLHLVDGTVCPAETLADICSDCTEHVATATLAEMAQALNRRLGLLAAQTYTAQGGRLNMEIPSTITLTLSGGRTVTIDVDRAIKDGVVLVALSCPRNEHGRGQGSTGLLETGDWAQAQVADNGDDTLNMHYGNGVYRVAPHHN